MAEPLFTLVSAIRAAWVAAGTPLSQISGPWWGERPADTQENPTDGTHFPYAIFPADRNRCRPLHFTCGNEYTEHDILIRIYDILPENCAARAGQVKTVFDSDSLALTPAEGSVIMHRPAGDTSYPKADKNVYYVDIPYYYQTVRART